MGQYYVIANFDKKELLYPYDYDNGAKLMAWSYNLNAMVLAFMNLMAVQWKGDRVYVIGDYADGSEPDECWANTYIKVAEEYGIDPRNPEINLYDYARKFDRILPDRALRSTPLLSDKKPVFSRTIGCTKDNGYRFIYNHKTRQFIDIKKMNIEWTFFDDEVSKPMAVRISPLTLLLAMGNGRGGGDYFADFPDSSLVGTWCDSVERVEVSKDRIPGCDGYSEFTPRFTMNDPPIPYTEVNNHR